MNLEDVITAAWEDGNCVGLDGWIGEARGSEPDVYAIRRRDEFVSILAAKVRKARTVTTVEELDALPMGTVVRDVGGFTLVRTEAINCVWKMTLLPARILWHPEADA